MNELPDQQVIDLATRTRYTEHALLTLQYIFAQCGLTADVFEEIVLEANDHSLDLGLIATGLAISHQTGLIDRAYAPDDQPES